MDWQDSRVGWRVQIESDSRITGLRKLEKRNTHIKFLHLDNINCLLGAGMAEGGALTQLAKRDYDVPYKELKQMHAEDLMKQADDLIKQANDIIKSL